MILKGAIKKYIEFRREERSARTAQTDEEILRTWGIHLRNKSLEEITLDEIVEYKRLCREYGLSAQTIGNRIKSLRNFLRFCHDYGLSIRVNIALITLPRKEYAFPKVATDKQVVQTKNVMNKVRDMAILGMLDDTAVRVGELSSLNVEDVSTEQMKGRVVSEKSRNTKKPWRPIFWKEQTNEVLKKWLALRNALVQISEQALFITLNHTGARRLSINRMQNILWECSRKAGCAKTLNPHSLRHKKGNEFGSKGWTAIQIADLLGHAKIESAEHYARLNDKQLEGLYRGA